MEQEAYEREYSILHVPEISKALFFLLFIYYRSLHYETSSPMLQYYYYYYLFTAIGFAPGGSGPYTTQLQQKNIQYQQQKTYNK
jgi:hypothetical protein